MEDSFDEESDSGFLLRQTDDLLREWSIGIVSQAALNNMLEPNEAVLDARPRSWWYAHRMFFGLSVVGTVVFLGTLIWQVATFTLTKYFYYFLLLSMFPIFLLGSTIQALRARTHETWVAVTSERIIQYTGDAEKIVSVRWANILAWRPFTNWLMWSKEIELKVF